MKRIIRNCVWETNSSMTHSCIVMTPEQYKRWEEEKLYYYPGKTWYDPFEKLPEDKKPKPGWLYTQDEVLGFYKLQGYEPNSDEYNEDEYDDPKAVFIKEMGDFASYTDWAEDEYLEFETNNFTLPSGEEIIVACKYGRDG